MRIRLLGLGPLLLAGLLIGSVTTACETYGSGNDNTAPRLAATAAPTTEPTSTVPRLAYLTPGAVSPTSAPTTAPTTDPLSGVGSSLDPMGDDLLELGKKIFDTGSDKADQIGCQYCHAPDGKGNIGPNIRGKLVGDIAFALDNVESMLFLRLNNSEIEAVSEYLKWLATQP